MQSSFSRKRIEVHLQLAEPGFGPETRILRGLGCDVEVRKPGLPARNSARIVVRGMSMADMERCTTLAFHPLKVLPNRVAVYAGDAENDLSLVFSGDVAGAWPDFNAAPNVLFRIEAVEAHVAAVTPAPVLTASGAIALETVMRDLAARMGMRFVNHGVTGALLNPALSGGPLEKALAAAEQAGFELILEDGEMALLPPGRARPQEAVLWSPETGLCGYPSFTQTGVRATALFCPSLRLGGLLRLETIVPKAAGPWKVISLRHTLQAEYPQARAWHTAAEAAYYAG